MGTGAAFTVLTLIHSATGKRCVSFNGRLWTSHTKCVSVLVFLTDIQSNADPRCVCVCVCGGGGGGGAGVGCPHRACMEAKLLV